MKRFLFAGLFLLTSFAKAEEVRFDFSGGMWSSIPATRIPDNAATYIENAFTDEGSLFKQRRGTSATGCGPSALATVGASQTVQGLFSYNSPQGTEYIVSVTSGNCGYVYRNTANPCTSGSITPLSAGWNTSSTQTVRGAANLGKLFLTNGVNTAGYLSGTTGALSFTSVTTMPKGTLVAPWRSRIAVVGSTDAISTIYFSADGDGTNWTLGGNPTDPFTLQVGGNSDGKKILCLARYGDDLIVGKYDELWKVSGSDQQDVTLRKISSDYGCMDQGSVQEKEDVLLFMSNRGIVELAGESAHIISDPVRDITDRALSYNIFTTSQSIPMSSAVYQGRYWLAISTNPYNLSNYFYNPLVLVYQRNKTWTLFKNINVIGGLLVWKDYLLYIARTTLPSSTSTTHQAKISLYYTDAPGITSSTPDMDSVIVSGDTSVPMQIITKRYNFNAPHRYKEPRDLFLSSDGSADWDDSDPYWTVYASYDGTSSFASLGNSTTLSANQLYVDKFPFPLNGTAAPFYDIQFKIDKNRTLNYGEAPALDDMVFRYNTKEPG